MMPMEALGCYNNEVKVCWGCLKMMIDESVYDCKTAAEHVISTPFCLCENIIWCNFGPYHGCWCPVGSNHFISLFQVTSWVWLACRQAWLPHSGCSNQVPNWSHRWLPVSVSVSGMWIVKQSQWSSLITRSSMVWYYRLSKYRSPIYSAVPL